MSKLQKQVREHGAEIEEFIRQHSKNHTHSDCFRSLTTLDNLFKSMFAMNQTLLKALDESKRALGEKTAQIDCFLQAISAQSGTDLPDLPSATSAVQQWIADGQDGHEHVRVAKQALRSVKVLEKERVELQAQISAQQHKQRERESRYSAKETKLSQRVDTAERRTTALRSEVSALKRENAAMGDKLREAEGRATEKRTVGSRLKCEQRQQVRMHGAELREMQTKLSACTDESADAWEGRWGSRSGLGLPENRQQMQLLPGI
jgi:predicted  nucleic acid-binding Zn-ribbon protein